MRASGGGRGTGFHARVLVAEDENIIARDIEQTLKGLGYSVCGVVDTAEEAVRRALAERPDLILLDIRLRGPMDGIEAAERILQQMSVPVVFLTAFADAATLERARAVAPYGYVLKPFDDRDLQVTTMLALAKHEAFRELDQRVRARTDELLRSEARFRHMSAVAELGLFALGSPDLQPVMDRSVRTVCETLAVSAVGIWRLSADGRSVDLSASNGWPEGFQHEALPQTGHPCQTGYSLQVGVPVISGDYTSEERFRVPAELVEQGHLSGASVVIHSLGDQNAFGVLVAHARERRIFTVGETAFLQAVANLISTSVARSRADQQRQAAERAVEEERLRAAQAKEALRLRDDFLSIASHELKTPLTSLQLQLQSLAHRADALEERLRTKLDRAMRSMDRLGSLVENLLDVSRLTTGRLEVKRQALSLGELVEDVVGRLTEEARQRGCEIKVEAPGDVVEGVWDRVRIEQVVTNLLGNAMKYGGGQPIEIGFARSDPDAMLWVKDHGPGVEAADLGRIFERFERAAPIRHYGGLGLGLYISRQIVEAHGGTISVESEPGQGATFVVRLPLDGGAQVELGPAPH